MQLVVRAEVLFRVKQPCDARLRWLCRSALLPASSAVIPALPTHVTTMADIPGVHISLKQQWLLLGKPT